MAIHRKILSTDKNIVVSSPQFVGAAQKRKNSVMAQEIELKFIVAQDGVETLREQLNALEAKHTPAGQLLNIYYETADNWLRRHDMGLRIRGDQGRYEMTLKIAGRVVGGLHQRPEYNIPLDKPELALERLPAEVWPQGNFRPRWRSMSSRCSAPILPVNAG